MGNFQPNKEIGGSFDRHRAQRVGGREQRSFGTRLALIFGGALSGAFLGLLAINEFDIDPQHVKVVAGSAAMVFGIMGWRV